MIYFVFCHTGLGKWFPEQQLIKWGFFFKKKFSLHYLLCINRLNKKFSNLEIMEEKKNMPRKIRNELKGNPSVVYVWSIGEWQPPLQLLYYTIINLVGPTLMHHSEIVFISYPLPTIFFSIQLNFRCYLNLRLI